MTAKQAREIADSKKDALKSILREVEFKAGYGYYSAVFSTPKMEVILSLEALGYQVVAVQGSIVVNW